MHVAFYQLHVKTVKLSLAKLTATFSQVGGHCDDYINVIYHILKLQIVELSV